MIPAFIPSPSSNGFHIGPLFLHAYGIAYVFAVAAAIYVARRRWEKLGGSRQMVYECALWGFPVGVIGGRIYFDITTPSQIPHHWWGVFAVWDGGLGIWGGIAAGVAAGLWRLRRARVDIPAFMDAAAPGLLCAQAIGRVGNYFNQELFGKPSTLPWALKISPVHRPPGYLHYATFQPTFLYEIVWNLSLAGFLVWLGRHRRIRAPGLFALYVAGYSGFRVFEETLRIDYSQHILGMRLNFWIALLISLAGLLWFAKIQWGWRLRRSAVGAAGIAWLVACAAGCGGSNGPSKQAALPGDHVGDGGIALVDRLAGGGIALVDRLAGGGIALVDRLAGGGIARVDRLADGGSALARVALLDSAGADAAAAYRPEAGRSVNTG